MQKETVKKQMTKNKHGKIRMVILCLVVLFLVVGVPVIINESYKITLQAGTFYVTKWEAADMLAYYGAVLGGGATILALVYTIAFTRKQLQRDHFLEKSYTRWEKVDSIISQALLDISPLQMRDTSKGTILPFKRFILSSVISSLMPLQQKPHWIQ